MKPFLDISWESVDGVSARGKASACKEQQNSDENVDADPCLGWDSSTGCQCSKTICAIDGEPSKSVQVH